MTNSRPSRPRQSRPSYGSSSPSTSDADERMGSETGTVYGRTQVSRDSANQFFSGKQGNVGGHTRVSETDSGKTALVLYDTVIATRDSQGNLEINTDGYRTKTTKERINAVLSKVGANISQRKGTWFIEDSSGAEQQFTDGVKLNNSGKFTNSF